jgi:hypothetical protein
MIEVLDGFPPNVAAFKASGQVTKQDYDTVVMPKVDAMVKKHHKINFLLDLETDVGNFTMGAWVNDALVGLKHLTDFKKVAIISHQENVKKVTNIMGHFVPGTYKGFTAEELEEAKKWVSEE